MDPFWFTIEQILGLLGHATTNNKGNVTPIKPTLEGDFINLIDMPNSSAHVDALVQEPKKDNPMLDNTTENGPHTTFEGPRPARLEERDELIAMINFVFRTSEGRAPTIATDWPHVYTPENLVNVRVMTDPQRNDGEKIVASTGVWVSEVMVGESTLRVGGINCVGTLPDYRRHGLGSQVMAAAHQTMRDLGCQVGLLSTGIINWYRRMGWEDAGRMRTYRLNRGNIGLLPKLSSDQRIRFVDLDSNQEEGQVVAEVVRLHNLARLGALRTEESFRQLTEARQMRRIVLSESEGGLLAYLLLQENRVVEWAGSAQEVAGLVRTCFETLDDPKTSTSQRANAASGPTPLRTLALHTPGWQHPLVDWLDSARLPYSTDYLGMLYVVDPRAILDIYGLSSVRVEETDGEFNITHQGKNIQLNRSQLTKFFFGPERISPYAAGIFPLPFWQWGLEKV